MSGTIHIRRRAACAAWMVVLWLVGVEVMPNAHLALHDESTHTHDGDGGILAFDRGEPDQASLARLWREHESPGHDDHRHPEGPSQLVFDHLPAPGHGAGGLAHHSTALHQPPLPIVAPLPIAPAVVWSIRLPAARLTTLLASAPSARGPPGTSAMSSCLS